IGESLVERDLVADGVHQVLAGRGEADNRHYAADAGGRAHAIFELHHWCELLISMNLTDDDSSARGHLGDGYTGAQIMVTARISPVTHTAIGLSFTQFCSRIVGVGGGGAAGDRGEKEQLASDVLEVTVMIAGSQGGRTDGHCRLADRNAEVPGVEIDH